MGVRVWFPSNYSTTVCSRSVCHSDVHLLTSDLALFDVRNRKPTATIESTSIDESSVPACLLFIDYRMIMTAR